MPHNLGKQLGLLGVQPVTDPMQHSQPVVGKQLSYPLTIGIGNIIRLLTMDKQRFTGKYFTFNLWKPGHIGDRAAQTFKIETPMPSIALFEQILQQILSHASIAHPLCQPAIRLFPAPDLVEAQPSQCLKNGIEAMRIGHGRNIRNDQLFHPLRSLQGQPHSDFASHTVAHQADTAYFQAIEQPQQIIGH